jgi:hypothetical protein
MSGATWKERLTTACSGRRFQRRWFLGSAVFAVTMGAVACAQPLPLKSAFDVTVPQIGYLKARVEALYQAEQAREWRSWYLMTSPEIRKESSYEEFVKEFSSRTSELVTWSIRGIKGVDDSDLPAGAQGAKVEMIVHTQEGNGPLEMDDDQADYWLYLDREWYWVWRGWPDD